MDKHRKRILFFCILGAFLLNACVWQATDENPDFLPLDDSEYPYSGLPRLVIETDDFKQIRDKETLIPSRLQIYGKTSPESDVKTLTVKGRGNSSLGMSKYSMKLEFETKQELFGMPSNRDWVLISNHADKTLLRNYMTFNLARLLQMDYVPRCTFVEVFLNRDYMGVYLLTEKIKVSKNRVDLPKDGESYLVEFDIYHDQNDSVVTTKNGFPLKIHFPKNCGDSCKAPLKHFMDNWEYYIENHMDYDTLVQKWIDIQEYTKYYWLEEFSKNIDSNLRTSVFFTWSQGGKIKMGPIWDVDLSYGEYKMYSPKEWVSMWSPWNKRLFLNSGFKNFIHSYWKDHRHVFLSTIDSLDAYQQQIQKAASNNFKRWPVLGTTFLWEFNQSYDSHQEAVDSLKSWIRQRIEWIDGEI